MLDESHQTDTGLTERESSNGDGRSNLGTEAAFALGAVLFGAVSGIAGMFIGIVAFALEQMYARLAPRT